MNYRHAYHAGGAADVFKHVVLTMLVDALQAKEKPFSVLDTHAGIGCYDLAGAEAGKTGEWRDGIGRLLGADAPEGARPYLAIVRAMNGGGEGITAYPGSPAIVRAMLRPQDRLRLVELHPEDLAALKRLYAGDGQVAIHHRDAYEALKALTPPPERRGLALIDPAFEVEDEFARMVRALAEAHRRWPSGIYALWHPIKHRAPVDRFHGDLVNTGIRRILAVELTVYAEARPDRLTGSGLAIVNPPFGLEAKLAETLPPLQALLAQDGGIVAVRWLVPE